MKLLKTKALIGIITAVITLPVVANAANISQTQITNGFLTIINNHSNMLYEKCGRGNPPDQVAPSIPGDHHQVNLYKFLDPYFANNVGVCAFYSDSAYQHEVAAVMIDLYSTPVVLYPLQVSSGYAVITNVGAQLPYSSTITIG